MANDDLPRGLLVKAPHPNAPDFVICKLSVKIDEFIATLQANNKQGWCNFEVLRSREKGTLYSKFDTFEPKPQGGQQQQAPTPPPFNSNRYEGSAPNESDDPANDIQM